MNLRGRSPIRVLVVDDSPVVTQYLSHVLASDPAIRVVGVAFDGEQAVAAARRLRPDVITMDIHMPRVDGFAATRQIMETVPTPIVIVTSSSTSQDVARNFRALEAGAVALIARPPESSGTAHDAAEDELLQTVKLMAEVTVIRRWPRARFPAAAPTQAQAPASENVPRAVVVGASTGGPLVLQALLAGLPRDFPLPVLIVQHLAPGFVTGFVEWLSETTDFPVCVAEHGHRLHPSGAYVAPDGFQMGVSVDSGVTVGHRIVLERAASEHGMCPAVSYLFRSAAAVYGPHVVGVLLSGMGSDGARELKVLRDAGAVTIAQDEATSVVFGMPGCAVALDAASHVLAPEDIVRTLASLARRS